MKLITAMLTTMTLLASAVTEAQTLTITRGGSRPVRQAPPENFTGAARVEMLFETLSPLHASAGSVTFEPGARTAWHSHPAGQILIVTAGTGRVQRWGDRHRGDPYGRRREDPGRPEALARGVAAGIHDAHRDHRTARGHQRPVDGEGDRRAVQRCAAGFGAATLQATASHRETVRTSSATHRAGTCEADGRRAVRRCVEAIRVVASRSQPGDDLGLDRDGKPAQLAGHLGRALDNGVQASEASGVLAHLAIYSGWPSAVSALDVYDQVYTARKVDTTALSAAGSAPFSCRIRRGTSQGRER